MSEKKSVYDIVTERILAKMAEGKIPWRVPWRMPKGFEDGYYRNGVSKKAYRGINRMLLACSEYKQPDFFTTKQVNALGGTIKDETRFELVTFWKQSKYKKEEENSETGEIEEVLKKGIILRYYRVYNRENTDGLPAAKVQSIAADDKSEDVLEVEANEAAEALIAGYKDRPEIIETQNPQAYYSPSRDVVHMPNRETFCSNAEWYSSLFHELTHSTGSRKRLNREDMRTYGLGKSARAREELTAEMGAAFCCESAGILMPVLDNTAAYLQSWAKQFKGDPKCVVLAAQSAQKAFDWLTGKYQTYTNAKSATASQDVAAS